MAPTSGTTSGAGASSASFEATGRERPAANPIFTCTGIARVPNGGTSTSQALARTRASRKPTSRS